MPQLANHPLPILVASKHVPYIARAYVFDSRAGGYANLTYRRFTVVTTTSYTYSVLKPLPVKPHFSVIIDISRRYTNMASATSFYDFKPLDKKGKPYPLEDLKGKVVLVVNTASKCGFTPQFGGLETLYKEIKAKYPSAHPPHPFLSQFAAQKANKTVYPDKFEIIGFPCNQFGSQDPDSNDEIQNFCQVNYGVSFPVLGKTNVNGDEAEPVYQWMKKEKPGLLGIKAIKWNFEKFLIDKEGKVVGRWASTSKPDSLAQPILAELQKQK